MSKTPVSKGVQFISLFITVIAILYAGIYFFFYKNFNNQFSSFASIPIINDKKTSPGYTLIAPYNRSTDTSISAEGKKIYLLDMMGSPVHIWTTTHQPLYAVLKENGNLLVALEDPEFNFQVPPGGNTGIIQELDWNSQVVWEYKNNLLHHDIVPLKNGNIIVSIWEKTPPEIASGVQGGPPNTELNGIIWSDAIVELDRNGNPVWTWHSYEHLNPEVDVIGELIPRYAWTLTNGMQYLEKDPLEGGEALLLSMRSLSTVMIVRKSDGQIIWRSPKGMLNVQHDPSLLENGNILAFDNGLSRTPNPHAVFGSRVVEIDPKDNKVVWEFNGGKGVIERVRFLAPLTSGAQRLRNGNTLVVNGPKGHLFEVTKDGELVWDMVNPYTASSSGPWPVNFLFKAKRYYEDQINWPEKIKPAIDNSSFNLYRILDKVYSF